MADSLISSKSAGSSSSAAAAPKTTEHILVFDSAGGASGMEIPSRPASLPLRGPVQSSKQPVKALLQRQKSSERKKGQSSLTPTPSSNATPIPPSRRSSGSRRSRTPERRTRSPRTPDRSTTASFSAASSTATLTAMQNVRRRSRTPDASHKTTARPVSVVGTGDAAPAPMTRNDPLRHSFGRGGTASSLNIENFSNKNNMLSHITKKRNKRQPSPIRGERTTNLNATYPQIQYINSTNLSGGRKKGIVLDGGDRNNYEEDDC